MTSNSTSLTPVRRSFSEGGKPYSSELSVQRRINVLLVAITIAIIVLIARSSAHAQTNLYWDTSASPGVLPGNGDWSTASADKNWNYASDGSGIQTSWFNPTISNNAIFQVNSTPTSAVTVEGTVNVNSITFNGTGYSVGGTALLTLTGVGGNVTANADATINAPLGGTVGLTKLGGATLTLGGTNTYSGSTQVSAGTLLVNGSTPSASAVTVSGSGTTLGGTGTVGGIVLVNTGSQITGATPTTVGTLNTGALTLNGTLNTDATGTSASAWDKVVSSGTITLGPLSTLDVTIASGLNFTAGSTYVLLSGTALTGVFNGILDGQTYNFSGYDFIADYTTTGFNLVVVPEPSTWIGAGLALGAIGFMQRKRFAERSWDIGKRAAGVIG